jgi:hypothetical protein
MVPNAYWCGHYYLVLAISVQLYNSVISLIIGTEVNIGPMVFFLSYTIVDANKQSLIGNAVG